MKLFQILRLIFSVLFFFSFFGIVLFLVATNPFTLLGIFKSGLLFGCLMLSLVYLFYVIDMTDI